MGEPVRPGQPFTQNPDDYDAVEGEGCKYWKGNFRSSPEVMPTARVIPTARSVGVT